MCHGVARQKSVLPIHAAAIGHAACGQPLLRAYPFQGFVTTDRLRFWLHRPRWLCTLSHITDLRQRPSGGAVTAGRVTCQCSGQKPGAAKAVPELPALTRPVASAPDQAEDGVSDSLGALCVMCE